MEGVLGGIECILSRFVGDIEQNDVVCGACGTRDKESPLVRQSLVPENSSQVRVRKEVSPRMLCVAMLMYSSSAFLVGRWPLCPLATLYVPCPRKFSTPGSPIGPCLSPLP